MSKVVLLDSGPLSLVTKRPGQSKEVDACQSWLASLLINGATVYLPEIADYETRRELIRSGQIGGIVRLNSLAEKIDLLRIDFGSMRKAAELRAQARNLRIATADKHALDGDVILCAQALSLGLAPTEFVIATSNVKHLSRFVPAEEWANIQP
jgi:predicted nucleic acid-binding protein